jgi:3-oxoacyl-[acyl-carrier-protein] synthase II
MDLPVTAIEAWLATIRPSYATDPDAPPWPGDADPAAERRDPVSPRRAVHASACAGGTLALIQAARWIDDGMDAVLCGGGDSMLNPLGLAGLHKLGVPSLRGVCRPFDARRDGILVGEGAGCFVVEEEGAARARGARVLAVIRGWGDAQDGHALTAPDPSGHAIRRTMAQALASVDPRDVTHVNAHGTGTPLNDEIEATVLAELVPGAIVGSFKGAIGHTMAAAGAVEFAGVVMSLMHGEAPGTCGFERPDARCPVNVGARGPIGRFVLKNSFGFGGQDASVLLER